MYKCSNCQKLLKTLIVDKFWWRKNQFKARWPQVKYLETLPPKCFVCYGQNLGGHILTLPTHFLRSWVLWCTKTATEITIPHSVPPPLPSV